MSPWMICNRGTEEAFNHFKECVHDYLDHWFFLMEEPFDYVDPKIKQNIEQHDQAYRNVLFRYPVFFFFPHQK